LIHRRVDLAPEARSDLRAIYLFLAEAQSAVIAKQYVDRILAYVGGFDLASERGSLRDDIAPGLRLVGFERRITIAFTVEDDEVIIQRIFYAGQDWASAF